MFTRLMACGSINMPSSFGRNHGPETVHLPH
ncbi:hypothetical protein X946_3141 [Burkholderia sp. ABCPW 111]|nr:hypothetical protein X946_3141 [Burkholderia sp. ABCPW 111]